MNLIIKKNLKWQLNNKLFKLFLKTYLMPEIYLHILASLDSLQLYKWDIYLKDNFKKQFGNQSLKTQNILLQALSNLKCKECQNYYMLHIDYTQIIPKTTAKLYDICALINSGTLDISPYPIFKNVFRVFSDTQLIKKLFEEFLQDFDLEENI